MAFHMLYIYIYVHTDTHTYTYIHIYTHTYNYGERYRVEHPGPWECLIRPGVFDMLTYFWKVNSEILQPLLRRCPHRPWGPPRVGTGVDARGFGVIPFVLRIQRVWERLIHLGVSYMLTYLWKVNSETWQPFLRPCPHSPPAWEFLGPYQAILSHLGGILGLYWVWLSKYVKP